MIDGLTRDILIVGGGTSGWLCAAYMANTLGTVRQGGPRIRLMEASDIPTIGVGESTIPPIRSVIAGTGIDEVDFLRETNATFKMAIRFDGWRKPVAGCEHGFFHAFGPHGRIGSEPLAPYWLVSGAYKRTSFVDYSMNNGPAIAAGKAPKRMSDQPFKGPLDYAYHFDAGLLAELLKKRATSLDVEHIVATIDKAEVSGEEITAVVTADGRRLTADLFVDCTGFSARLIEQALGEPFVSASDTLFCDRAVACQVPYRDPECPIPPFTRSSARPNGWIWDVPLMHRRGTGFVYSSAHISDEDARDHLISYLGDDGAGAEPRLLRFRVGHRDRPWRGNCVAIGLSAGFIEPLESTGIYFSDIAIRWLTDFCLDRRQFPTAAKAFNERMQACYADVLDFIKLHYVLSDRDDTAFWVDNRAAETVPASLREKLEMWAYRMPSEYEFGQLPAVFGYSNYVQLLLSLGHHPELVMLKARYREVDRAARIANAIEQVAASGLAALPGHRDLLSRLARGA
ncbi:Flavin-dependent tryptophan halogenase RebH [Tsuneonella dongtanensis]|uniref:Flavin-dependent tryptophan halogenase RebH n=1 Tax=Tsuneonella dongtanensis TaxID=692370 RepID=A0A1B2AGR8_9SPHN|nr:tryptophan halogenase family protein [Tsuneonella dongtanensis]ANY21329.1 Flavin-dependent tryptophan halogenase RebH [Tsuneonella dongtanensis]